MAVQPSVAQSFSNAAIGLRCEEKAAVGSREFDTQRFEARLSRPAFAASIQDVVCMLR